MNELVNQHLSANFVNGGFIKLNTAWNTKNVVCPESKLFYILEGEIAVEINGQVHIGKQGDMMLIPAELKHSFYLTAKGNAEKFWMHFDLKIGGINYFENYSVPYKISVGENVFVKKTFSELLQKAKNNTPTDKLTTSANVLTLVAFYTQNCIVTEKRHVGDEIERVITYLKSHYDENPTVNDLCNLANLSPNYFVKKFKERTGYPPMRYLTVLKIELAKFLLQNTEDSVSKIMEQVGFFDQAHFSKVFKSLSGHSPRNYRELYGKSPFNVHNITTKK
jgi:AraC-like DNA-binding protein